MAEDGALAAGEDRGHEAAVEREPAVSHGVDAAVDAMELAPLHAAGDAVLANSNALELGDRDHAALPRGDFGDPQIEPVEFLPQVGE